MTEEEIEEAEVVVRNDVDEDEIRDTDIVFDCPHCGKNLVIDYRGAGLQINCSECGETVLVPIPDGMELRLAARIALAGLFVLPIAFTGSASTFGISHSLLTPKLWI